MVDKIVQQPKVDENDQLSGDEIVKPVFTIVKESHTNANMMIVEETKDPVTDSTETCEDFDEDAQFSQHEVSSNKTNRFQFDLETTMG